MPKIPLYNQGKGAAVQTAAGALSPRASAAVFTAPGQAQAAFAKQAGDVAFRFAEEQARAETNRVYSEELKAFDEQQLDFNLNNKDTDTTVYAKNYESFSNNFLNSLRTRTDLNDTQKEKIEQKLMPSITASRLQGTRQAFARGQDRRRVANNESLALITNKIGQTAIGSPERMRLETEAYGIIDESITDGLGIDYSRESFNRGVFAQDIGMRSNNAKSVSDFETLRNELDDDVTLGFKTKETLKKQIAQDEDEYRANLLQSGVEVVKASEFTFQEAELAQQKLDKGEAFTLGGQTFDPSDLKPTQRGQLASVIAGEQKDLEDLSSQNIQNSLSESDDIFVASTDLFKTENKQKYWQSDEQKETIILNAAEDLTERIVADITAGNVSNAQGLANDMQSVLNMINYDYRGAGSLLQREGSLGDTAATLQQKIAAAQKDLVKAVQTGNRKIGGENSLKSGTFTAFKNAANLTDKEEKTIVDDYLTDLSENPDEPELFNDAQINVAAKNNVKWEKWEDYLSLAAAKIQNPDVDVSDADIMAGVELFRTMDQREQLLLLHTNKNSRAVFDSFMILEKSLGTEGAIETIRMQRDDININAKYKEVEKEVEQFVSDTTTHSWYSYIPFLGDDAEFVPTNVAQIRNDISLLTKEHIKTGLSSEKALERAATEYGKTHVRVRNIVIPRTKDLPMNIEELATSAVNYLTDTEVAVEGMGGSYANRAEAVAAGIVPTADANLARLIQEEIIDPNDLSLFPIEGQTQEWFLVENNQMPVMGEDGKNIKLTLNQLQTIHDASAARKKEEARANLNKQNKIDSDYQLGTGLFEGLGDYEKQIKKAELEGRSLTITWDDISDLFGTKFQREEKLNTIVNNWAGE